MLLVVGSKGLTVYMNNKITEEGLTVKNDMFTLTDSDNSTYAVTTKKRVAEIDIAKAIGIICVFIGHRTTGGIHNYIYLFHMPLFFILSGYMMKGEKQSFRQIFICENKLLSSYFIYSIIFIFFGFFKNQNFGSFITNVGNTFTMYGICALWFLSCLWIAKVVIRLLNNIYKNILRHVIVITIYVTCYWTSLFLVDLDYSGLIGKFVKSLSWSIVRVGVILIFVYLGYIFKSCLTLFLAFLKTHSILCVLFILLSCFLLIPFIKFDEVDYHLLKNGLFILNVVYGVIGTLFILSVSIIIAFFSKKIEPLFVSIGKNSTHYMASEYFDFSGDIKELLGVIFPSLPYIRWVSFGIYCVLIYFAIWLLGPFVNKGIESLAIRLDSIIDNIR